MTAVDDHTLDVLTVVALAARGLTNRQIGDRLYLSKSAVQSRLARGHRQYGTRNRAHLVAVCLSCGDIPPLREDPTT